MTPRVKRAEDGVDNSALHDLTAVDAVAPKPADHAAGASTVSGRTSNEWRSGWLQGSAPTRTGARRYRAVRVAVAVSVPQVRCTLSFP